MYRDSNQYVYVKALIFTIDAKINLLLEQETRFYM